MSKLKSKNPLVSVIMSVYRPDLDLLEKSLSSLIGQTYPNIEIILIDDGLSESESKHLSKLLGKHVNIKYIKNSSNIGLTKSLNKGIKLAKGELIARQDADDVSNESRIEKQVERFKINERLGLLGAWYKVKLSENTVDYMPKGKKEALTAMMFTRNPFCHSSVMFRKCCLNQIGLYDEKFETTQDLDLWFRMAQTFDLEIIEEILIERNLGNHAISYGKKRWLQLFNSLKIRLFYRKRFKTLKISSMKIYKSFLIGIIFNVSPLTTNKLQNLYIRFIKKKAL